MEYNLENDSLWYKYKTRVWTQESPQTAVVHNVMRMLRSVRGLDRLAYASVPITSGRFLYELKLREPDMGEGELLEVAISHNYLSGFQFVELLWKRRRNKVSCPILFPADMVPVHQGWEQEHFQALWMSIIAEMCTEVHMGRGWQFSNGCVEEFTHVMQLKLGLPRHPNLLFYNSKEDEKRQRRRMKNIPVFDYLGNQISLHEGRQAIREAALWLHEQNMRSETLEHCSRLLVRTHRLLSDGYYQ